MVTVVDPLGTPTVIFNKSGTAIVSAETVDSGNPAVEITKLAGLMVVVFTSAFNPSSGFKLLDFEVGDQIYFTYTSGSGTVHIYDESDVQIGTVSSGASSFFMRLPSNVWVFK